MVNHWYSPADQATACGTETGEYAKHVSTGDPSRVSCSECMTPESRYHPLAPDDADDMCPNCLTPWKCNGPHVPPLDEEPLADWERELLESVPDPVAAPDHYRWMPVEAIEITELFNFNMGNALKYIIRADFKGKPVEDLRKAAYYVNRELKRRGFND